MKPGSMACIWRRVSLSLSIWVVCFGGKHSIEKTQRLALNCSVIVIFYSLFLRRKIGGVRGSFHVEGVVLPDEGEAALQVSAPYLGTDLCVILQGSAVRMADNRCAARS